jgi:ankyrin repeat protein
VRFSDDELTSETLKRLCVPRIDPDCLAALLPTFPAQVRAATLVPEAIISHESLLSACIAAGMIVDRTHLDRAMSLDKLRSFTSILQALSEQRELISPQLLAAACQRCAVNCVKHLLTECKLSASSTSAGMFPLHHIGSNCESVKKEKLAALVDQLLKAGADIEAVDKTKLQDTPILKACRAKITALVSVLAEKGAKPFARAADGHTLLSLYPSEMIPVRAVPGLSSTPPHSFFHSCCPGDVYLLHYLINLKQADLLHFLVPRRTDWDLLHVDSVSGLNVLESLSLAEVQPSTLATLLSFVRAHHAHALPHFLACVTRRHTVWKPISSIIEEVVNRDKAGLNHRQRPFGNAALHHLVATSSILQLAEMLKHGADPNIVNDKGETPLHTACSRDPVNPNVVAALLGAGADPARKTVQNESPLLLLCQTMLPRYNPSDHAVAFASLLIKCDKETINCADSEGNTVVLYAAKHKNATILNQLIEAGADATNIPITGVCTQPVLLSRVLSVMKERFDAGTIQSKVNQPDAETKQTPLVMATKYMSLECVQLLLDAGADVNQPDVRNRPHH